MNSIAGIQLLCFKNKYMEVFSLCQSFLYWSVKVLKEKWWQWGNHAAVWAASYLLTPSRGGGAPQHPHKSLVSVRGKVREQEMTKGRIRNKRFPRSGGKRAQMQQKEVGKESQFIFIPLQRADVWTAAVALPCPSLGAPVMLVCHKRNQVAKKSSSIPASALHHSHHTGTVL